MQDQPDSLPGIVSERLYVFVGVLLGLVAVAVGICIYVRFFHARKESLAITQATR